MSDRLLDRARNPDSGSTGTSPVPVEEDAPVIDPVCGMTVGPATSEYWMDHGGQIVHFCSADCRAKCIAAPNKYLKQRETTDGSSCMRFDRPLGGDRRLGPLGSLHRREHSIQL